MLSVFNSLIPTVSKFIDDDWNIQKDQLQATSSTGQTKIPSTIYPLLRQPPDQLTSLYIAGLINSN